jgi:hypothetical protein
MLKRIYLILFLALVLTTANIYAQATAKIVVLLQGQVIDTSGKPVAVNFSLTDDRGKTIRVKSNINGGKYQAVLKPGKTYTVSFKGYLNADTTNTITIPAVTKYTEIKKDFTVKKIKEGLHLCQFNAFKPQDSVLTGDYKEHFERMRQFLRENINASVVITVTMKDSYFKKKRVKKYYKDKRGRRRYKRVWVKADEQLKKVLEARLRAVRNYIDSLNIRPSMVNFKTDDQMGPKPKKKKKKKRRRKKKKKKTPEPPPPPPVNNIFISVGKMMKI